MIAVPHRQQRRRQAAERYGRLAEHLCVWRLRFTGYRVLRQRLRTPVGEVDILARRGDTLMIVEVKARTSLDTAAFALPPEKQRRLMQIARYLHASSYGRNARTLRFDVMLVAPWRWPRHIVNAFGVDQIVY